MLSIYFKTDDWHEVDFNDFNLALNDTMQNVHNPVKISTEYSKTISLPLSAKNREIINHYSRLDSLVTDSFDPTKSIPARIEADGNIVFEGAFALTKVNLSKNTMEGNFYSTVNTWFNKLKRITWDDLPNCLPDNFDITKERVYDSWKAIPQNRTNNFNLPDDVRHYKWTDWIGFAPTLNGELSDFSNDAMFKSDSGAEVFHPWEVYNIGGTEAGIDIIKTIIPKPNERQMLQFRSYYQKPYIYVDMLFRLIEWYSNSNNDLPYITWDEEWTSDNNPNWRNLIYLLPNLLKTDDKPMSSTITYGINNPISYSNNGYQMASNSHQLVTLNSSLLSLSSDEAPSTIIDNGWIIGNGKSVDYILPVQGSLDFTFKFYNYDTENSGLHGWNKKLRLVGQMYLDVELVDNSGNILADSTKTIWNATGYNGTVYQTNVTSTSHGGMTEYTCSWTVNYSGVYSHAFIATANTKYKPRYVWHFKNQYYGWTGVNDYNRANTLFVPDIQGLDQYEIYYVDDMIIPAWATSPTRSITIDTYSQNTSNDVHRIRFAEAGRSGRQFTMKDIWSNEENNTPFMVMLKYIKMFNLAIVYDNFSDTIKIMPKEKFFAEGYNSGIEDWTDKVDFGKEMSFTPLSWEDKYIEFNYESTDFDKVKSFKEKYGWTYGTKRIETSYTFNNETKQLLEDADSINASAEMTEYMFNMYQLNRIASNPTATVQLEEAFLTKESYLINMKDSKMSDLNNCFAYRWDYNNSFDRNINRLTSGTYWNYLYITDDCQYENNNSSYNFQPVLSGNITFTPDSEGRYVCNEYFCNAVRLVYTNNLPRISHYITKNWTESGTIYSAQYCCLFSQPREDYFNPSVVSRNNNDLWSTRWSNLITELYSVQNKLLTCYIYLTPSDYNKFKFNKFVIVDDVLYLVNKIIDYNPASLEATKCELIQVTNPDNYTTAPSGTEPMSTTLNPGRIVRTTSKGETSPMPKDYVDNTTINWFYLQNNSSSSKTVRLVKNSENAPTIEVEWSPDGEEWTSLGNTTTTSKEITFNAGEKKFFRCQTNAWSNGILTYNHFYTFETSNFSAGGNVMSLLYGSSFNNDTEFPSVDENTMALRNLFTNFTYLKDVSNLLLPAMNLPTYCYYAMFSYSGVTNAPALPAKTLSQSCYGSMFRGCTSLTSVNIEATTPATSACVYMLNTCTHLTEVTCMFDTIISNQTNNWLVDSSESGTFYKKAGVQWPEGTSGIPSGWTVVEIP